MQEAAKLGTSLEGVQIVDPDADSHTDSYVSELVQARSKKGLSPDAAADLLHDGNYFATMMVRCGDADGMVSGAAHTTAATVRPGMQVRPDVLGCLALALPIAVQAHMLLSEMSPSVIL